ncbi:MAG: endonuclease, partial [bacterium]
DHTAPTILGVVPNTVGPTSAPQITFSVQFSEAVSGLDNATDVQINTTGTVSTSSLNFSANTSATQQIIIGGITGTGNLSLSVLSNSVTDQVGFQNNAGATSVNVAIDPNVVISGPVGLLFSEIVVQPTGAEFMEIHNPGSTTIDLSDVYLTDATFSPNSVYYYNLVNGTNAGGGGFEDFNARFPDGSSIAAGDYQTIALQGSTSFQAAYGILPDYELYEDDVAADAVADMREATAGSINGQGQLSDGVNDGEVAVLYYWDGSSDLIADLDYLVWGDKNEAVSKTGISIDGPDADTTATPYLNDTDIIAQAVIRSSSHADGLSWQRVDNTEGNEIQFGGNGLSGHNETSEDLYLTWGAGTPTPGSATDSGTSPFGPNILINEVDANATAEFVEFFDGGTGPVSLNGLSLVFFDGATDQVSISYDLDGLSTNNEGYFVAGNASTSPDLTLPDQSMLDGPAAVAIYIGNAADFPAGSAISTFGLIDAVVYGDAPTDSGLLPLLNIGQDQVSEGNDASINSLQRCPNGGGGVRNTANFASVTPTIGLANMNCPVGDYYANVDASTPQTLRTTLHNTIKDHQRFPYTSSATDTWDILEMADESPSDSNAIWAVYKNVDYPKAGGGNNNYNREHTWPKSLGFPGTDDPNNYPVTDAHHLMLSDSNYNSHRGNKYYDDCIGTCTEDPTTANHGVGGPGMSNWYNGVSFETWDFRKGDVARAMFYMDVRYEGGTHSITGSPEPDLILTDDASLITQRSDGIGYMGLLSTLLEWNAQDPVDAIEQQRNEVVFSFQGNRNPFIDHPEWIACIFQNNCSVTPSEVIFSNGFE